MRKRYSEEDLRFIEEQASLGTSCKEIGDYLQVSAASIQHVLSRRGIKFCRSPIIPIIGEVWVNCFNIPDIQVSNMGRFMRISSNSLIQGYLTGQGYQDGDGYITVEFSGFGAFSAHRLIAQIFIPNPENKPEVNHIDGCKTNNCVGNLEWVTPSENIRHSIDIGLRTFKSGQEHHRTVLNEQEITSCINMRSDGMSYREIADIYGVSRPTISNHINRRSTERPETIP